MPMLENSVGVYFGLWGMKEENILRNSGQERLVILSRAITTVNILLYIFLYIISL